MIPLLTLEQNHALNMCFAPPQKHDTGSPLKGHRIVFLMHHTHCSCQSSHFLL